MKIGLVWPGAEMSVYDVAVGLREGFLERGHEVVDYRLYRRFRLAELAYQAVTPEGMHPDVAMCCKLASEALTEMVVLQRCPWVVVVSGIGLHPDALLAVKRVGTKVAVWFTEAPYDSQEERELYLCKFCDLALVNERTSVPLFQARLDQEGRGGCAIYFPHAYRPEVHRPVWEGGDLPDPGDRCDVLMIGTGFSERQWLLEAIDWAGIDLRLGGLWPGVTAPSHLAEYTAQRLIPNEAAARLYRGAKIVLNCFRWPRQASSLPDFTAESLNPRLIEAAACGAFQLSDWRAEVEELFGESVPTFQPGIPWQLAELIRKYLAQPEERQRLARRAWEQVRGATFGARAQTLVELMSST